MINFKFDYNSTTIILIIILVILIICLLKKYKFFEIETFDILDLDKKMTNNLTYIQKLEIQKLLKILHKELSENNILYSIYKGSLLGAVRHKNIIPWNNNANIFILENDENIFSNIDWNKYGCRIYKNNIEYKFYFTDGKQSKEDNLYQKWNFPYINIAVFKEKDNKLISKNINYQNLKQKDYIMKNELYPLKLYQLGDIMLYGPNDPYSYLTRSYDAGWEIYGKFKIDSNTPIKFLIIDYLKKNDKNDLENQKYLWIIENISSAEKNNIINTNLKNIVIFIDNKNLKEYLPNSPYCLENKDDIEKIKRDLINKYGGEIFING